MYYATNQEKKKRTDNWIIASEMVLFNNQWKMVIVITLCFENNNFTTPSKSIHRLHAHVIKVRRQQ